MSVGYKLTPRAQAGLQDMIDYVEREIGSRVAEEVLDRIAVAFELLAEIKGLNELPANCGHRRDR